MPLPGRKSMRWLFALFAALLLQANVPAAFGQVDDLPQITPAPEPPMVSQQEASTEARLKAVESELKALLEANALIEAHPAREPTIQIGGLINVDYLYIGQDRANRLAVGDAQDGSNIRRARLRAQGVAFEVVEYAIGFDFALEGRPSFLDNYIAVRELPLLGNVRGGHFFEPFSLERFTAVRYTTFMERSLADTFAPARNLGLVAHNSVGNDERGTWAIGWFRSDSNDFGDDFGDNGEQAVTSRVTWLPFYHDVSEGRSLIHVGGGYTYRSANEGIVQFESRPEARAGTPGMFDIPSFVDTGPIAAASDQRLVAELAWIHGPFSVQSEYMCSLVDRVSAEGLFFQGAYAFVSYFLTGENRTYNKTLGIMDRLYPFENFFRVRTDRGIETGLGAWEVAARWSFVDLDDGDVRGGTLHDLTFALNWYLNPYTRVQWEYIQARLDRQPVGDSRAHIFGMRLGIDF